MSKTWSILKKKCAIYIAVLKFFIINIKDSQLCPPRTHDCDATPHEPLLFACRNGFFQSSAGRSHSTRLVSCSIWSSTNTKWWIGRRVSKNETPEARTTSLEECRANVADVCSAWSWWLPPRTQILTRYSWIWWK